jgi:hypothetical protein
VQVLTSLPAPELAYLILALVAFCGFAFTLLTVSIWTGLGNKAERKDAAPAHKTVSAPHGGWAAH